MSVPEIDHGLRFDNRKEQVDHLLEKKEERTFIHQARTHASTHASTHPRTHARTHVCAHQFLEHNRGWTAEQLMGMIMTVENSDDAADPSEEADDDRPPAARTHALTHARTRALTHSRTHALAHAPTHPRTHAPTRTD